MNQPNQSMNQGRASVPRSGSAGIPPPAIILVRPQLGQNIGAAARAMANFGLTELRLVEPRDGWPNAEARTFASGANGVIDGVRTYASLEDAVGDLHFLLATTARPRDMVKPVVTAETGAAVAHERVTDGQRVGFVFGPERTGLENDEVALANAALMVPVDPGFASINLAQTVLVCAYEWRKQSADERVGRHTAFDGLAAGERPMRGSRPAERAELIGLFEHLERELDRSGFLRPPEKRQTMVRNIRNILGRMEATEQEVRTLRGIVASLAGAHRHKRDLP